MRLDIPFITSPGFECGQACMAMVIKYFKPTFKPDFNQINRIIRHKKGKYTHPPQLALLLDYFGIKTKVFSSDDIKTSQEDPGQFKRWFGKDYEHEMKFFDLDTFNWTVREMRKKQLFRKKKTEFDEIIRLFKQGKVACFPIDWETLNNKTGVYSGHFVILSGLDGDNVLIHDPDFSPYIKYPLKQVKKAWEHPAIADDLIVAYGVKIRE